MSAKGHEWDREWVANTSFCICTPSQGSFSRLVLQTGAGAAAATTTAPSTLLSLDRRNREDLRLVAVIIFSNNDNKDDDHESERAEQQKHQSCTISVVLFLSLFCFPVSEQCGFRHSFLFLSLLVLGFSPNLIANCCRCCCCFHFDSDFSSLSLCRLPVRFARFLWHSSSTRYDYRAVDAS